MSKLSLLYLLKCVVFCRYLKPIIRHSTFKLVIGHLVFCLTTKNNGFRCISNLFEVLKGFSTCQQRWIKRYSYHASFQSWTIYYSRTLKWITSSWTSTSAEQISIGSNLELSGFYYIRETKVKSIATGTILFIHFWAKWGFSGQTKTFSWRHYYDWGGSPKNLYKMPLIQAHERATFFEAKLWPIKLRVEQ